MSKGGVASEVVFAPLTETFGKLSCSDCVEDPGEWLRIDVGSGQDPRLSLWAPAGFESALALLMERRLVAWGSSEIVGHMA